MMQAGRECRDGFAWQEREIRDSVFLGLWCLFWVFFPTVVIFPISLSVVFCSTGKRLIPSAWTKFCMVFGFVCCLP